MELKEFVKAALTDIVEAVKETQEAVRDYATIAPLVVEGKRTDCVLMEKGVARISNVDFDVAVTTESSEQTGGSGKTGIQVAGLFSIGGEAKLGTEEKTQNLSRIKFSIPVLLPHSASLDQFVECKDGTFVTRRKLIYKKNNQ